ncbi:AI-2E family transporter [Tetragenococcus halophilus]|uniref:AI-2E family transporter n=2 Tax=Tetragenococcus halophilus TaxID=51669 RepID=A0AB35HSC8_TETHA|nr:AI-2E family transporter [Tetragenococcus halophilus]AOF49793.1 membrane protein [Tetragenococcus halophilus]MCF1602769.1 AI-2E family transporter [Tetragenococcus halophilus]MCF1675256.1 AI-2E family transporter [Tetragenococcus halophilus]MCO8291095.1 AI-2E family transporter [Tetragenococcus halophilus]MCO8293225.1 AI-2E family transporter [Tetragenococcus halophilus]
MKNTRWIKFLGGSNVLYTLTVGLLLCIFIITMTKLDFIFGTLAVIISNILMPIIIALLLYYLFNPAVDFMERHKIKRVWGIVILFASVVLLLAGGIVLVIPLLDSQISNLTETFPLFINNFIDSTQAFVDDFSGNEIADNVISQVKGFVDNFSADIGNYISEGLTRFSSVVTSITSVVMTIVIAPIILFFLLKDAKKFTNGVLAVTPPKWRADLIRVATEINVKVGSYIKGQLVIAVANGVMIFIGFTIIGLDYSGILGLAGGILSLVPYIGPTLTFIPALIIALLTSWTEVFLLIVVWIVVQFVEGNFVEPNIMGRQLNIHPLTIIIILLIMGDLLGLFGLVFGVPIYAILRVIVNYIFQKFKLRYNKYYGDVAGRYHIDTSEITDFGDDNIYEARDKLVEELVEERKSEPKKKHK